MPGAQSDSGRESSQSTFFNETSGGKFVPRALYADLEPTVIGKYIVDMLQDSLLLLSDIRTFNYNYRQVLGFRLHCSGLVFLGFNIIIKLCVVVSKSRTLVLSCGRTDCSV